MKEKKSYTVEKRFAELFGLMPQDDLYIRETPAKTYFITVPHPTEDIEYVLSTWEKPKEAREFIDLGRCVNCALRMGAGSIRFKITPPADLKK